MFQRLRTAAPDPLRRWLDRHQHRISGLLARATGGPVPFDVVRRGDRVEALLVTTKARPATWVSGTVAGAFRGRGGTGPRGSGYIEVQTAEGVGALRPEDVSEIRIVR
jgi:hypothetical protein